MNIFMRRCLELATEAEGATAPNPMVGAVIVHQGRIIGEGKHAYFGGPHAEVVAIESVADKSLLPHSTLYVSLEPCCHYGKTPPCTVRIIAEGIPHVVVAAVDPFSRVHGAGVQQLQAAGIKVEIGMMEQEARNLNRFFYTYHEKKRPHIFFKWAESLDGFIDRKRHNKEESPAQITGETMRAWVHRWRAHTQAIMVGTNTVLLDNPSLTVRNWSGSHPLRVTFDRTSRLYPSLSIFNDEAPTLLFVEKGHVGKEHYGANVLVKELDFGENREEELLTILYELQIQSLMIEGGSTLIERFVNKGLWDEAYALIGNMTLGHGVQAPRVGIRHETKELLGDSQVLFYRNSVSKNQGL